MVDDEERGKRQNCCGLFEGNKREPSDRPVPSCWAPGGRAPCCSVLRRTPLGAPVRGVWLGPRATKNRLMIGNWHTHGPPLPPDCLLTASSFLPHAHTADWRAAALPLAAAVSGDSRVSTQDAGRACLPGPHHDDVAAGRAVVCAAVDTRTPPIYGPTHATPSPLPPPHHHHPITPPTPGQPPLSHAPQVTFRALHLSALRAWRSSRPSAARRRPRPAPVAARRPETTTATPRPPCPCSRARRRSSRCASRRPAASRRSARGPCRGPSSTPSARRPGARSCRACATIT